MARNKVQRVSGIPAARHIAQETPFNALAVGTLVLTLDGALPVEYLAPGDRVITRDSGTARLRALHAHRRRLAAVTITPGTLGHMRPDHEVTLPAMQEILLRDWRASALFGADQALVPLARLVDGTFIREVGKLDLHLCELVFDTPHILYADGLELASAGAQQALA
ncbi:Hint domain-containing protein [Antarctobacter heliothermus]|uniref:Hint domain-containing protein n=1 Tax=Antarctobacter heliothermus TaxID=74033 RepID=A0A239H7V7_9RHOB|nr:Hint domain-containing protein [Antarctobacter heliothermus]SNS77440.1 Hint domain-containing protein [Antarctobacter heliothermus]